MYKFLLLSFFLAANTAFATRTINDNLNVVGKLTAQSTTSGSSPCPVMTEAQRDLIAGESDGDCIYNSTAKTINVYDSSLSQWVEVSGSGGGSAGENALQNPSFENGTGSWTSAAGTVASESSVVIHESKSLSVALTAQTLSLYQDSTLHQAQFADAVQGIAQIRVKTSVSGVYVCSRKAGVVSAIADCVAVSNSNIWASYKVPFILGATSNGIEIKTTGNVTGTVYVDDAFVGATDPTSVIATCTTIDCETEFGVKVVDGAVTTTVSNENLDWINGNCTNASTGVYVCPFNTGVFSVAPNCTATDMTGSGHARIGAVSNTSVTVNGFGTGGGGLDVDFQLSCQKAGVDFTLAKHKATAGVFAASCGTNCVNEFNYEISATPSITTYDVAGITVADAGAGLIDLNYSALGLTVVPSIETQSSCAPSASVSCETQVVSATTTTAQIRTYNVTGGGNSSVDTAFSLKLVKQGADYKNSRVLAATFKEVNTSPGIIRPKTCYYYFGGAASTLAAPVECSTGTCVEVYDSCDAGSAPAFNATGQYTDLTFAAATWAASTPVYCNCTAWDTTTATSRECMPYYISPDQTWSSSATGGYVTNINVISGTTATNSYTQVSCTGEAP